MDYNFPYCLSVSLVLGFTERKASKAPGWNCFRAQGRKARIDSYSVWSGSLPWGLGLEMAKDKAAVFYLLVLTTFVDGESKFAPAGLCGTVIRNSIIEFRSQFLCFCVATSKRYRMSLEVTQTSKDNHSPTTYETMENIPQPLLLVFPWILFKKATGYIPYNSRFISFWYHHPSY